jgi:KUP system potassium uptake protein
LAAHAIPLKDLVEQLASSVTLRVRGTAVFMTGQPSGSPPALLHNVQYNKMLHQCVVILAVRTVQAPYVADKHRLSVQPLGHGVYDVWVDYGFMDTPDVPRALAVARSHQVPIDEDDVTYFLGRETIIITGRRGMAEWREQLFVFMARNAGRPTSYFRLPPDRVVELGVRVEM